MPRPRHGIPGAHDASVAEGRARFTIDSDQVAAALPELARRSVTGLRIEPPSLEELFLRHYGDDLHGDAATDGAAPTTTATATGAPAGATDSGRAMSVFSTLLRQRLRRDRWQLLMWIVGTALLALRHVRRV